MFISFEGLDGSGKTTQARLLAEALEAEGARVVRVREPGGTPAGERIRELLLDPGEAIDPAAEALLYAAARAQLVADVIAPALADGAHVVADRFIDSSLAYQGVARGLGVELAQSVSDSATEGLRPAITLLLRTEPEEGLRRAEGDDRFEREGLDLQEKVAAAYEEIAEREPGRVVPIDASGTIEEVHARVMAAVAEARG